jgi:hypothetical protein
MSTESTGTVEAPLEAPPGKPRTVIITQPAAAPSPLALVRLGRMADGYFDSGAIRQAMEVYFTILQRHSGTAEAARAWERLMAIAEHYEKAHGTRQARSIYERLL